MSPESIRTLTTSFVTVDSMFSWLLWKVLSVTVWMQEGTFHSHQQPSQPPPASAEPLPVAPVLGPTPPPRAGCVCSERPPLLQPEQQGGVVWRGERKQLLFWTNQPVRLQACLEDKTLPTSDLRWNWSHCIWAQKDPRGPLSHHIVPLDGATVRNDLNASFISHRQVFSFTCVRIKIILSQEDLI